MNTNLDQPIPQFRQQLHRVADMVADLYSNIENKEVYSNPNPEVVRNVFEESIPNTPESIDHLLSIIQDNVFPNSTIHFSPHFYPWVTSCASQASLLGDFLATALNVNSTTWMNSAATSEIERQVIKWIGQFSGYDNNASGVLVSGGSTANHTGLQVARFIKSKGNVSDTGLKDHLPFTVYASEETHFCIDKSVDALGIGKEFLRKIKTHKDFTMDLYELEKTILNDLEKGFQPMCIVGNAGTVNTGAVDRLGQLADLCKKYNLWFHLDAAYGGCASNLETTSNLFKGIDRADSIAIDLHKWFFVPFEAGCVMVKDKSQLKQTFSVVPEYQKFDYDQDLQIDFSEYSFQQSRNFKALKIWMNFKAYGQDNLKKAIQGNIDVMSHLAASIEMSSEFELIVHSLSIVCFRYIGNLDRNDLSSINELNYQIVKETENDKRVFIRETKLNGMVVLRGCCTNFRREKKHVEYLLTVLSQIGKEIEVKNQLTTSK